MIQVTIQFSEERSITIETDAPYGPDVLDDLVARAKGFLDIQDDETPSD